MKVTLATILILCCATTQAQIDPVKNDLGRFNRPTISQRAEVAQKIGLDFIKINYARPNVRNRKIFGGILEFGKIWRLGADYQTVIDFQNEYVIQGDTVQEGKYALYAIPNKDNWTVFLNKDTEGWGQYTYKAEDNRHEFNVEVEKSPEFIETFTMGFSNTALNNGELFIQWENSRVCLPITVSNKHKKEIETHYSVALGLNEKSTGYKYYLAGQYLFLEDKNYKKALKYIQKAIDTGNNIFFIHFLKGEILLAMGQKKAAVESAIKAKENLWEGFSDPVWENQIDKAIKNWGN